LSKKMAYNFSWKPGTQVPVSAPVAAKELERIRIDRGGFYQPQDIVDESRPDEAPLHPVFEWDDSIAAEAYRVDQARYIIRGIVVQTMNGPDEPHIRPIVSIVKDDDEGRRAHFYTATFSALEEPDLREQILANALRDAQAFCNKYSNLEELSHVFYAVEQFKEAMRGGSRGDAVAVKSRRAVGR
jgi:hypothetical protein